MAAGVTGAEEAPDRRALTNNKVQTRERRDRRNSGSIELIEGLLGKWDAEGDAGEIGDVVSRAMVSKANTGATEPQAAPVLVGVWIELQDGLYARFSSAVAGC